MQRRIGKASAAFFNKISSNYEPNNWNKLLLAPFWMKKKIFDLNGSRSRNAKRGKKAIIIAKMNAIVNKILIDRILFVSNAGV